MQAYKEKKMENKDKQRIKELEIRIKELEARIKELEEENEALRSKPSSGRKIHDEKWMKGYNEFLTEYQNGTPPLEITQKINISRRTLYRYLAYYREINGLSTKYVGRPKR